jgi:predicted dehydrogenase
MTNTNIVKYGLIGAGGIAQAYAQAFETSTTSKLVAVADVRPDAAQALAERLSATYYPSYEAMVSSEELDAVIICTPPITHLEIAGHCLENGINVLCEKPLSIDSESAKQMIAIAQKEGKLLTMASKFRYVEDVIKAKSLMASGILGEIILFENAFTARVDMSNRWNANPAISGGGVLIDNGTHSVDIMRYFLGPLSQVQVFEGKRVQTDAVEDTVRIFAKSETGVIGNVDLSWSINKDLDSYIRIYGTQGTISIGWKESKYKQTSSPDWIKFGNGYDKVQAFGSQLDNFARAIHGEEKLLITAADALASVQVVETAYAAMRNNQWTAVPANQLQAV